MARNVAAPVGRINSANILGWELERLNFGVTFSADALFALIR
jgi:hypothetical protein